MDRYFYIIEADNVGNKQIRMECNVYGNQEEGYHYNEWVGCILGIGEAQALIKDGEFSCKLCELARYSGDVTEDEANAISELYFDGTSSGEELNITDITYNTPCGCYYFDVEPDTLKVCEHCLMAIESREGNQVTRTIYADADTELKCDWCGETEIDKLYELL